MSNAPKFKVGDNGPGGPKIAEIFGESDSILVYRDEDYDVHYYVDAANLSDAQSEAVKCYNATRQQVYDILPKIHWKRFQSAIGMTLFEGLHAADRDKASAAFEDIRKTIAEKCTTYRRAHYFISSWIAGVLIGAIFWILYLCYPVEAHRLYALCIVFGIAGAMTSVVQRAGNLDVGEREDRVSLWIRGTSRVVAGGLFAAFFVVASKANLVAGIATSTTWTFLAFSFIAGVSERYVPELITQLEKNKSKTGATAGGSGSGSGGNGDGAAGKKGAAGAAGGDDISADAQKKDGEGAIK